MSRVFSWLRKPYVLVAVVVIMLGYHAGSLMAFPPPDVDEAWLASRAWALATTGQNFGSLDAGVIDRFEGYWTFFPWLPTAIQSLPYHAMVTPTLLPLRIISLLFGVGLLVACYYILAPSYGTRIGLLGVLLVFASLPFMCSAHIARCDIMAAALGFGAIAMYLGNTQNRLFPGYAAGLCLGAAFEIHPHAAIYVPALLVLQLYDYRRTLLRQRAFWAFIMGLGTGLSFYVLQHIVRYPATFVALNRLVYTVSHTPPILGFDPDALLLAVLTTLALLANMLGPKIALVIWASVWLGRHGTDNDRRLLLLSLALTASFAFLVANKIYYYAILFSPALDLIIAVALVRKLSETYPRKAFPIIERTVLAGLCVFAMISHLSIPLRFAGAAKAYSEASDYIGSLLEPGDSLMSSQVYWFELSEHVYYSWESLVYFQRYQPGATAVNALSALRPDIFVLDSHMRQFITDQPGEQGYAKHLWLPRAELNMFLQERGQLIGSKDVPYYGPLRVYRIAW